MFVRKLILSVALVSTAPIALTGCTTLSAVTSPVGGLTQADEKAMYACELFFKAASNALQVAAKTGVITGEKAETARVYHRKGYEALLAARAAHKAANRDMLISAIFTANESMTKILGLLK